MAYWLIVYLFSANGEFIAKDIYETASFEQCVEFSSKIPKTIINTQIQAQFHCVSDEEYRLKLGDDK